MTAGNKFESVDEYLSTFPKDTKALLEKMRSTIIKAAPKSDETISYNMPAYKLNGILVYFAGYKNHIGFYPGANAIKVFADDVSKHKSAKGLVQFPITEPFPLDLIEKIVQFRVEETEAKLLSKKEKIRAKIERNI